MRIRRSGVLLSIGVVLLLLAVVVVILGALSIPRFQGLDVVPERLVFDVTLAGPGDEPVPVSSTYEATGLQETLTIDFPDAEVTSVSVVLSEGNLSDAQWECTPSKAGTEGDPERFASASHDNASRAGSLENSASSYALLFNLPDPVWTKSMTMSSDAAPIDSISCRREGDLAPIKAPTYRFFAPPIVTLALNTDLDIDLTRSPQVYMAGEWEPSDAVWTSTDPADHTSIASTGAVQWRDSTLVLHDAIWDDILDRWNFIASALVGALAGLAVSAIAARLKREVVVEPATVAPTASEPALTRRFRRRFSHRTRDWGTGD